ncbi:hypothetical protein [uncultured Tateyamaria sp.]|uniref:hypothetical protein n=1 Tax=Tateyamaria sp. 1078 TaxID=3417464 RepID=UPI002635F692|nr:hypothetical protein [uncultured Tateyamaria sp.]
MDLTLFTTADVLLPRLGTGHTPTLFDVCVPKDVAADPWRLPGAQRFAHRDIARMADRMAAEQEAVVICQKGLKLSIGVAAHLRALGHSAHALAGGVLGWGDAGLPRIRDTKAAQTYVLSPPCTPNACLAVWLIRRWIAPMADILWVPEDAGPAVADRFDGVHVPPGEDTAAILADAGLHWAPLDTFMNEARAQPDGWAALLRAPEKVHNTPDSAALAALPVIDAAWTALRKDIP